MSKTMRINEEQIAALERHGIEIDRATGGVRRRPSVDDVKAKLARLEAKLGVEQTPEFAKQLVAQKVGDEFYLDGKWLSGAELRAAAEEEWAREHELDDLKRELRLDRPVQGTDVHESATRLLASRGIFKPSYEDYADAIVEVS